MRLFIVFVFVMSFGVLSGMGLDAHGNMIGCPMMAQTGAMCDMGAGKHLGEWKSSTASVLRDSLLFIVVAVVFGGFVALFRVPRVYNFWKRRRAPFVIWKLFHYLYFALSRGILHPKIYSFVG